MLPVCVWMVSSFLSHVSRDSASLVTRTASSSLDKNSHERGCCILLYCSVDFLILCLKHGFNVSVFHSFIFSFSLRFDTPSRILSRPSLQVYLIQVSSSAAVFDMSKNKRRSVWAEDDRDKRGSKTRTQYVNKKMMKERKDWQKG